MNQRGEVVVVVVGLWVVLACWRIVPALAFVVVTVVPTTTRTPTRAKPTGDTTHQRRCKWIGANKKMSHLSSSKKSLGDILKALDDQDIRYSPTASRRDLERLLLDCSTAAPTTTTTTSSSTTDHPSSKHHQTYCDSADRNTRQGDETKRKTSRSRSSSSSSREIDFGKTDRSPSNSTTSSSSSSAASSSTSLQSLQELLEKLDQANLRYPPTASRDELERIWQGHCRNRRRRTQPQSQQQRNQQQHHKDLWQRVWRKSQKTVQNKAYKVVNRATQSARRVSRSVTDFVSVDEETGVRDVEYEYLYKEEPTITIHKKHSGSSSSSGSSGSSRLIDVTAVPIREEEEEDLSVEASAFEQETKVPPNTDDYSGQTTKSRRPRPAAMNGDTWASPAAETFNPHSMYDPSEMSPPPPGRRHPSRPTRRSSVFGADKVNTRKHHRRRPQYAAYSTANRPTAQQQQQQQQQQRPSSMPKLPAASADYRRKRRTSDGNRSRRVYSPYQEKNVQQQRQQRQQQQQFLDDRDVLDRLGEFFADTADRILWGPYDDDDDGDGEEEEESIARNETKTRSKYASTTTTAPRKRKSSRRHWKDRFEQRLDLMMGIHHDDDGGYYERWTEKYSDKHGRNRDDAPRQKPVSNSRKNKRPFYKNPIWEEEGNLVSLLLGRKRGGDPLFFQHMMDDRSGSLVYLFKYSLKTLLLLGGYVSRWASVRGALPQPVVVLGLTTAGLCAPRKRIRAMVIALIIMRTTGELIHSAIYGNEGWDDDNDDDEDFEENEEGPFDEA